MDDGFARRDNASPASLAVSLARAFRSSIASPGLFNGGNTDNDFSNSLPMSRIRPELSWPDVAAGGGTSRYDGSSLDVADCGGSRTSSGGAAGVVCAQAPPKPVGAAAAAATRPAYRMNHTVS